MKVANRKCICRLSVKSLKSAKFRNFITVFAVALTTILFTSLFTIAISMVEGFEQSNFRQVGGYSHGGFKYLSKEKYDILKTDPLIKEHGLRIFVGMVPPEGIFNKSHIEVGYSDENYAKMSFCEPIEGRLPKEGTNEAATDLRVLSLLGVEPEIGNKFTLDIDVDGTVTTETFTLCGYWKYDEITVASHVLLPKDRAETIFKKLNTQGKDGMTATYNMDVMLKNSLHIEEDLNTILQNHGYQNDSTTETNYIAIGVNWAYVGAQMSDSFDLATVLGIAAALLLIIFTGYLIIYNIFQISVAGDIRHYGLLKTIGTTGKQIRKIVLLQSVLLSVIGIPAGLLIGYGIGNALLPLILKDVNGIYIDSLSFNSLIFIGSTLFSLLTVLISCRRPSRIAGKVSPIEALRYTEGDVTLKKQVKKSKKRKTSKAFLYQFALANLKRNKIKTLITVISMSLAIVLLTATFTFTNGFDMEKYVEKKISTDYIIADSSYFNVTAHGWDHSPVSEELIKKCEETGGITDGGKTYGQTFPVLHFVSEEFYRSFNTRYSSMAGINLDDLVKNWMELSEKKDGKYALDLQLYGMDDFCLDKLRVIEGDISRLKEKNTIAAVYLADDYGHPIDNTNWAKLGDTVTIRYIEEQEYFNAETGEVYENFDQIPESQAYGTRSTKYRDVDYEVAALVCIPGSLDYRFYSNPPFVLNADQFIKDSGTSVPMYYAFDMTDDQEALQKMEDFISDYTENTDPESDYESRFIIMEEFKSFRSMFMILGSILSLIVGLIGILNFLNAVMTSIITRHREFAMLQSVGMTGKQLKKMLITEGLIFTLGSVIISLLLTVITSPALSNTLEDLFWFFSYHFTVTPLLAVTPVFILLGIVVPLIAYRFFAKKSIVERLRECE